MAPEFSPNNSCFGAKYGLYRQQGLIASPQRSSQRFILRPKVETTLFEFLVTPLQSTTKFTGGWRVGRLTWFFR